MKEYLQIGNTRIIRLSEIERVFELKNALYIKLENENPSGSIKDRAALNIFKNLNITRDTIIMEATSGNTGISLAMLSKNYGCRCQIVMPSSMSIERRQMIQHYGGEVILVDGGMAEAKAESLRLQKENPNIVLCNQFENPNNPEAHYLTTGPEIESQIKDLDYIAVGFGTGGTLCGTARYFKEKASSIKFIGIEPKQSPLITKSYAKPHLIQGIGANFIPEILDTNLVDEFISVDDKKSIEMAKKLFELEQLFVGYSTGANVLGIIEYIKNNNIKNKTFLTFAMDKGDRYTWN
jgi:cysteine synthase A